MTAKIFRLAFVLFVFVALSACKGGGKCPTCPTPPGGNGDDEPPPGQGGASLRHAVYEGEGCPDDLSENSRKVFPEPDATYILKDFEQVYTICSLVDHPQVPGRMVTMKANGFGYSNSVEFDEGDPSRRSPVGMNLPFRMTHPDFGFKESRISISLIMIERRRDLSVQKHESLNLVFRVLSR